YGSRRGSLAFRSQCPVPGRPLSDSLPHPVLDARFARLLLQSACLFQPAYSASLPLALWPESHGGRHRWLPLGADGPWSCAQLGPDRFCRYGPGCRSRGLGLFQLHGMKHRGPRMSTLTTAKVAAKRLFNAFGLEIRKKQLATPPEPIPRASMRGALQQLSTLGFRPRTVIDVGVATKTEELYRAFNEADILLVEPLAEFEPFLRDICR